MTNEDCSPSSEPYSSECASAPQWSSPVASPSPPMRKIPNFILLRAFEAAARLESFTLAAHELHLTPSAISHQVRELEEVFGRALFVRSNRRVDLTPEGRRLFESLVRIL